MPFKKRKCKALETRAIKRRLIEISIRVDAYIYKNKPITVEEAKKYVYEISIHRTQCNNDTHILQVTEKLTRCMKTIIEETTKKVPNQNVAPTENEQCDNLFPESSSIINKHKIVTDDRNFQSIQVVSNTKETTYKDEESSTAIATVMCDSKNKKEEKDNVKSPVDNENIIDITTEGSFIINGKNNDLNSYNSNTHRSKVNVTEIPSISESATEHTLIKAHVQSNTNLENIKQLTPNQLNFSNATYIPKENIKNNSNLILDNSENTGKSKNTITKSLENSQQILNPSTYQTKSKNAKKKNNSGVTQKSLRPIETLSLNAKMHTNSSTKLKIVSKKNKTRAPKKNANNDLPKETNRRKKTCNNNNKTVLSNFKENNVPTTSFITPLYPTANKYKHTHMDVMDEVSLPAVNVNNDIRHIVPNQDLISKQMDALTIYNEYIVNDLSWVENIRYVREISKDEYDQTSYSCNEIFWRNFSLPDGWNETDFID